MDDKNFVAPAPGGGFNVYIGGVNQGWFATQDEAEQMYNSLRGGEGPSAGALAGADEDVGTGVPSATDLVGSTGVAPTYMIDQKMQLTLAQMQGEIQQRQIDYNYARLNLIEKPSMENQKAYQEALIRLQESQQKKNDLQNQVNSQIEIWKHQNQVAKDIGERTGRYRPPSFTPILPTDYYNQSGGGVPNPGAAPTGIPSVPQPGKAGGEKKDVQPPSSTPIPNDSWTPAEIIKFLDSHPGFDPMWDQEKNQGMIAAYRTSDPQKALNAYGGLWDRTKNREPGADYEGSVQQMYDWISLKTGGKPTSDFGKMHFGSYGNLGSGKSPGGTSYDINDPESWKAALSTGG